MASPLPKMGAAVVDPDGIARNEWWLFWRDQAETLITNGVDPAVIADILARLDALEAEGDLNFQIVGLASVQVFGTPQQGAVSITLDGDRDTGLGPTWFYGTLPDGSRGWTRLFDAMSAPNDGISLTDSGYLIDGVVANITDLPGGGTVGHAYRVLGQNGVDPPGLYAWTGLSYVLDAAADGVVGVIATDDLAALEALATTGLAARIGVDDWELRTLQGPMSVIVTDGDGVAGDPSLALDGDVASPGALFGYGTNMAGTKGWYRPALFESTGLLAWSAPYLSINAGDPTKFDVGAAVVGYTDYSVNPVGPSRAYAVYGPTVANAVPNLAVLATWVGIQTPGATLVTQATRFTPTQLRTIVQLGAVISNGVQLIAVNNLPTVMRAGINQIDDVMRAVGPINDGNRISANGANINIDKAAGSIFKSGANFANNPDDPHNLPLAALTAASFNYRTSTGVQAATTTNINVTQYESAPGVLSIVGNNNFSVQRIYVFTSNLLRIQYGQTEYATLAAAEAAIVTQPFNTEANIAENGILLAFLIVEKNATALNNPAQAKFIPASKFGGPVGSGGTSITNTDGLPEGSVNLYFTNQRAIQATFAITLHIASMRL